MKAILLITSGTGPAEVREFVTLLAREMERRCQQSKVTVHNTTGSARSISLRVEGDSLDCLAREQGTHALVARSPLRSRRSRKRWFVAVRLLEEAPEPATSKTGRLVVTACRAGGPGGQNVNKRSTAVRVLDPASGIAVRVQEQRLQSSNRRIAESRIRLASRARFDSALADHHKMVRSEHYRVSRGAPVRTWHINGSGELKEVT